MPFCCIITIYFSLKSIFLNFNIYSHRLECVDMKLFFSEYKNDYATYTFSYAPYCKIELPSDLTDAYAQGFLPYSGDISLEADIFYMARSVRINLSNFTDTSENRRIDRKIAELNIEISLVEKSDELINSEDFLNFCMRNADERFSAGSMTIERMRYIVSRSYFTHLFVFKNADKVLGYVFAVLNADILHYWFGFYDVDFAHFSIGKWMMWRTIKWAESNKLHYAYLGTAYFTKALYKVRDHKGIEFFDGAQWNADTKLLKTLCERDENGDEIKADAFKSVDGENDFFKSLKT